jgi:hypothetical protein
VSPINPYGEIAHTRPIPSEIDKSMPPNDEKQSLSYPHESDIHSTYIAYVDESGDHGLQTIDNQYPLFVLAFCVF